MDKCLVVKELVERDGERLRNAPPRVQQLVERERKQKQPSWQVVAQRLAQILAVTLIVPVILLYAVDNRVTAYYWGLAVAGIVALKEYDRMRRRT